VIDTDGWEPIGNADKIEEGYRYKGIFCSDGSFERWRMQIPGYVPLTPQEIEHRRVMHIAKRDRELRMAMGVAITLVCDYCGDVMGYVAEFDLNGSQFFCNGCMALYMGKPK